MKFAEKLKNNYDFIVEAKDVIRNLAVYKTNNGPIFAVFSSSSRVKKYVTEPLTKIKLTDFECSHDLRTSPTPYQKERVLNLLKKYFQFKNPKELFYKIQKTAKKLEK
jgi:hypothetical protein